MRGIIYSKTNPPQDIFYQLSDPDIHSIVAQLKGVPVRVEHEANDVGTIVSASFDGTDAYVDWDLNQNAAGWTAETLINIDQIKELSLKHIAYSDGVKKPIEVSLVRKGARPATLILDKTYKEKNNLIVKEPTHVTVMASAVAPVEATMAAPVAEDLSVAAPVTEQAAVAAPTDIAPNADEPLSKKQKFENPVDFINAMATKVNDGEVLQNIADYIASTLEHNIANEAEIKELRAAKELLEQAQKSQVDSSKNVVSDITRVLSDLYSKFAVDSPVTEESKTAFMDSISNNPRALEFVRPIMVAASAIHQSTAKTADDAKTIQMREAMARISTLQQQLGSARRLAPTQPAPAVQPNWATLPMSAAPTSAPPPAAMPVAVAASAHTQAQPPKFQMPAILGKLTSYSEQQSVGRITSDMFSKKFAA